MLMLAKEKLEVLSARFCETNGDHGGSVLERHLAQNTIEEKDPRGTSEFLLNILTKNLYDPKDPAEFKYMMMKNRILENSCLRSPMWSLATSAYSVSASIHRSWVLRADELSRTSSLDCSKVRARHLDSSSLVDHPPHLIADIISAGAHVRTDEGSVRSDPPTNIRFSQLR